MQIVLHYSDDELLPHAEESTLASAKLIEELVGHRWLGLGLGLGLGSGLVIEQRTVLCRAFLSRS